MSKDTIRDYTHYHRTCQRCGKNWWGLHCPHDGYQNPCPECKAMPVVVNAHYCDCEFVVPVPELESLIKREVGAKLESLRFDLRGEDPDQYRPNDMISMGAVEEAIEAKLAELKQDNKEEK